MDGMEAGLGEEKEKKKREFSPYSSVHRVTFSHPLARRIGYSGIFIPHDQGLLTRFCPPSRQRWEMKETHHCHIGHSSQFLLPSPAVSYLFESSGS